MITEQQLAQANIPRRYWNVTAKDTSRDRIAKLVADLEEHFLGGDGFTLAGKDFATRTAVACWIGVKAMDTGNAYFRDKWTQFKPTKPHSKTLPYTVRYTDVQTMVELRLSRDEDNPLFDWAEEPDILIISELGVGRLSSIYIETVDEVLRERFNSALPTVVTIGATMDEDPRFATVSEILRTYEEIRL